MKGKFIELLVPAFNYTTIYVNVDAIVSVQSCRNLDEPGRLRDCDFYLYVFSLVDGRKLTASGAPGFDLNKFLHSERCDEHQG